MTDLRPIYQCVDSQLEQSVFDQVTSAAQPFLVSAIARHHPNTPCIWVVCKTLREQEQFYAELLAWNPSALFLPDSEISVAADAVQDPEFEAQRLAVFSKLRSILQNSPANSEPQIVVVNAKSFHQHAPVVEDLNHLTVPIRVADTLDIDVFIRDLITSGGYSGASQVTERGQVAKRGGIVDIFSWQHPVPIRIEFFGDEVESIREFDINDQTSIRSIKECEIFVREPTEEKTVVRSYVKDNHLLLSIEHAAQSECSIHIQSDLRLSEDPNPQAPVFDELDFEPPSIAPGTAADQELKWQLIYDRLREWKEERYLLGIFYLTEEEKAAMTTLLFKEKRVLKQQVIFIEGEISEGFVFATGKLAIISGSRLLKRTTTRGLKRLSGITTRRTRGDQLVAKRAQIDTQDLKEGDLIVHLEHGIGSFIGFKKQELPESTEEDPITQTVIVLEFAEGAKLYVPLEQSFLISKYVSLGKKFPAFSRLGDAKWGATKRAAERAIEDYAARLLRVQALRETQSGFAFNPDVPWQREFENTFPYTETGDQLRAIAATKADMESARPMDRLICGDVGFGKTEVAIRAAFKAVMDGKQVALLVPTTVLAQQHYENFITRMASFPMRVELLSRFRTVAEQTKAVKGLLDGSVDLVIGTHRIISKDVHFKNLGLLIVDEEHRFGVKHKEKIKETYPFVDILTLSATPIPRTLYLSLMGTRDLSLLETPPANRHPVETVVCAYDERIIRSAIERELEREGQVYFLHNRIHSIEKVREMIQRLCPKAKVDIGHGRMEERELEEVMHRFVSGKTDVLVATTIIESGLDIPNANTIFIDRADRFGLADLYQLRGRVGRGQHKAYAYLLLPRDALTVGEARRRLNAVKRYSELGAGFKVAMRDLEIRGAGSILGVTQSGHASAVGFDLYCQLLKQSVSRFKGEAVEERPEVIMRLDFVATSESEYLQRMHSEGRANVLPAFVPSDYITDPRLRIQAYRQLFEVTNLEQLRTLEAAWKDRFGKLPKPAKFLIELTKLKLQANAAKISRIEIRDQKVMLTRRGDFIMWDKKFPRLTSPQLENRIRELFSLIAASGH